MIRYGHKKQPKVVKIPRKTEGKEEMKMSKWKVTSQYIGDKKMYAVYRNINDFEPDHSGNREYATGYLDSKEQAQRIADDLNEH